MKQKQFTTIIIESEAGKFLTQGADVDICERIICTRVALGRNDSPNNWREISSREADDLRRQREDAENQIQADVPPMRDLV